jgi:hypothetical protein
MVVANEGGRGLETVCSTVGVEDVPFEGRPLQLFEKESVSECIIRRTEGLPTPGVLASGVFVPAADLAAAAAAAVAAFVAFAFATSRKFVPALLATLRILPLDPAPLPFFSFAGVSALESS